MYKTSIYLNNLYVCINSIYITINYMYVGPKTCYGRELLLFLNLSIKVRIHRRYFLCFFLLSSWKQLCCVKVVYINPEQKIFWPIRTWGQVTCLTFIRRLRGCFNSFSCVSRISIITTYNLPGVVGRYVITNILWFFIARTNIIMKSTISNPIKCKRF